MIIPFGALAHKRSRPGITLTEILIAILILGVGLISLATLFPIGLLRLRDAARYSRTAYLSESASSDIAARSLLNKQSFLFADLLNYNINNVNPPYWWTYLDNNGNLQHRDPFTQDTAYYGDSPLDTTNPPVGSAPLGGPGLPIAYDPLWRSQTVNPNTGLKGYYLDPINQTTFEARFGSGIGFIRNDPDNAMTGVSVPSAHGLQRITNFNSPSVMPAASNVPSIFVSPEDTVWQEPTNNNYTVAFTTNLVSNPSPVVPDLSISTDANGYPITTTDWRYSWMFTGFQTNATYGAVSSTNTSNGTTFEGNIVIFENRPFGIQGGTSITIPFTPPANFSAYQVAGETVVEAVFGYSANILPKGAAAGYGAGADRTVLLRWPAAIPDPVVKTGDWIADVTYERQQLVVYSASNQNGRFLSGSPPSGYPNPSNKNEWDNLPAQRCFWYQVQKVVPPVTATGNMIFSTDNNQTYHYMFVYVNSSLQARTLLAPNNGTAVPYALNAALISPYVVNVIPQTIAVR